MKKKTHNERQADAASVVVHVIHGEHPAAMQFSNSSAGCSLFFHSMFGALFGRNRNTDTLYLTTEADRSQQTINSKYISNVLAINNADTINGNCNGNDDNDEVDDSNFIVRTINELNKAFKMAVAATASTQKQCTATPYHHHNIKPKNSNNKNNKNTTKLLLLSSSAQHIQQLYELLSSQLHIIIYSIYKQFPNTIFFWMFHYVIGTVTIHLLLATNSS